MKARRLAYNPPKAWKKRDSDAVGLSIVAKLETEGADRRLSLLVGPETASISDGPNGDRSSKAASCDFLSCCYLCRSGLHGKDIYMYRGEKAFCSVECRHQQIQSEERIEEGA